MPFCCATAPTIFVLYLCVTHKFLLGCWLELAMIVKKIWIMLLSK
ncbi:hypothetical protein HMPREF1584_00264 [Gardnerella vaginalis JCP8481A]|nr:hypothetical protein HMPREF1584_00264 [Gardnerella vaginalis JCP8481A]